MVSHSSTGLETAPQDPGGEVQPVGPQVSVNLHARVGGERADQLIPDFLQGLAGPQYGRFVHSLVCHQAIGVEHARRAVHVTNQIPGVLLAD